MLISIQTYMAYYSPAACDLLLQIEAAHSADQCVQWGNLVVNPGTETHLIPGEEGVGQRRWVQTQTGFECSYDCTVNLDRTTRDICTLAASALPQIPDQVVKFLMPSRYCHPEAFFEFVPAQFGDRQGGALIDAMSRWIGNTFRYDNGISDAGTTATDSFTNRAGVCRDYAHVLIAMSRAAGIPARFVSAYAPDVSPQDFHAVVEVYLAGDWHLIDPTGMAQPAEIVRIGVGRDAADAAFMTSFGFVELNNQSVTVSRIG